MNNNISVIIPFYNSIETLQRLLDSILSGTLIPSEILLIDDGSTDSSKDLAMNYSKKCSAIKVLKQAHSGVSSARNLGLSAAKGSWISFLDADDYIDPDMFSLMYQTVCSDHSLDGCLSGYFTHKDNVITPYIPALKGIITSKELLRAMFTDEAVKGFLFTRLFRKDLLKDITFDQNINICEDLLFQTELFSSKDARFSVVQKPLYHYVKKQGSITAPVNFFENGTFIYKPSFDRIKEYINNAIVIKSYNEILEYSMYTLVKKYRNSPEPTVLHQIRLLQKEMKKTGSKTPKSTRRLAFETAPVIYSHFMK